MAKNMLKSYGRFELLELIYNMRKENLELRERCEKAEKQLETARKDFESRIEELRMQGAAKDLQIRMKKIEEQLRVMQKLTSIDVDPGDLPSQEELSQLAKDIEENGDGTEKADPEAEGKENQ